MPSKTAAITLIKGDSTEENTDYRDALPVNMYAVPREVLGAKGYMLCYPGLTSFGTGFGADRGGLYNDRFNAHYRVSGTKLIEVSSTGVVTSLGTIPGTEQVALPSSFSSQCIIADERMFLYSPIGGFSEVLDGDLGTPIDGVWIDGYYFLTDGEYIYHTDIVNEDAIDPLKFATAEFSPDPTLGVGKTTDNKAIVFGRYSIEYFANTANTNFAFSRIETRTQYIGIVATHAKCRYGNKWFIVGGSRYEAVGVHIVSAGQFTKISTREVDKIIAEYSETELSDIRMECRMEDDIVFVIIHLPNYTLCYNYTVGSILGNNVAWSYLKSQVLTHSYYNGINNVFDPRTSKWICGDRTSSTIGKLDNTKFTQYDTLMEWILYTPIVQLDSASVDRIEIVTIPGHTTTLDGTVAFSLTTNGLNYGTETFINYGEPSEYNQRFIINRIGYVRDKIGFRFRGATKSRMAFGLMKVVYG